MVNVHSILAVGRSYFEYFAWALVQGLATKEGSENISHFLIEYLQSNELRTMMSSENGQSLQTSKVSHVRLAGGD